MSHTLKASYLHLTAQDYIALTKPEGILKTRFEAENHDNQTGPTLCVWLRPEISNPAVTEIFEAVFSPDLLRLLQHALAEGYFYVDFDTEAPLLDGYVSRPRPTYCAACGRVGPWELGVVATGITDSFGLNIVTELQAHNDGKYFTPEQASRKSKNVILSCTYCGWKVEVPSEAVNVQLMSMDG